MMCKELSRSSYLVFRQAEELPEEICPIRELAYAA